MTNIDRTPQSSRDQRETVRRDGGGIAAKRRDMHRRWALKWTSVLLAFLAAFTLSAVAIAQAVTGAQLAQASQAAAQLPSHEQDQAWEQAQAYNKELAHNGQMVLGEATDPFAQIQGETRPASETDQSYVDALDMDGEGMMGGIRIPKINVDLPIYHGTSLDTLDKGAGHMYGTSLPVGGKDTHSVLSAHNGMTKALMFTHLDQLKKGDVFYLHVAGRTLAYKIDRLEHIMPDDFRHLTIEKGKDRVTLMTCWPYGRNTKRLLVSGLRASMPDVAPYEQDAEQGNPILSDPFALGACATMPLSLAYAGYTGWSCRKESKTLARKH